MTFVKFEFRRVRNLILKDRKLLFVCAEKPEKGEAKTYPLQKGGSMKDDAIILFKCKFL